MRHLGAVCAGVMAKDAPMPQCLSGRALTSVNLWMCIRGSRSNIHYDPYCNLLCVAVGSKRVSGMRLTVYCSHVALSMCA